MSLKLTQLPNWNALTKEEKARLKEVYDNKFSATREMISKKELRKVKPSNG